MLFFLHPLFSVLLTEELPIKDSFQSRVVICPKSLSCFLLLQLTQHLLHYRRLRSLLQNLPLLVEAKADFVKANEAFDNEGDVELAEATKNMIMISDILQLSIESCLLSAIPPLARQKIEDAKKIASQFKDDKSFFIKIARYQIALFDAGLNSMSMIESYRKGA